MTFGTLIVVNCWVMRVLLRSRRRWCGCVGILSWYLRLSRLCDDARVSPMMPEYLWSGGLVWPCVRPVVRTGRYDRLVGRRSGSTMVLGIMRTVFLRRYFVRWLIRYLLARPRRLVLLRRRRLLQVCRWRLSRMMMGILLFFMVLRVFFCRTRFVANRRSTLRVCRLLMVILLRLVKRWVVRRRVRPFRCCVRLLLLIRLLIWCI